MTTRPTSMSDATTAPRLATSRLFSRTVVDVPCTIDLEQSPDSLHAYVELEGVAVGPGDEVLVHDAPTGIGFGERAVVRRSATVRRAGWWQRFRARLDGYIELTELYEVSFSEGLAP